MFAELLLAYTIDETIPVTRDIERAIVYVQDVAREHDLEFPTPNTSIAFTISPEAVPRGFYGFDHVEAFAARNVKPCRVVFVDPAAARKQSVIRHEIMHCLGAEHSPNKLDLMAERARNENFSKRELVQWRRRR